jgi:UDP-N-acetylglucosamine--N-acetylmuramyl-(pentapeptide) pyrophosphoryl-undecaprenol N-acetylglucosamine transferase
MTAPPARKRRPASTLQTGGLALAIAGGGTGGHLFPGIAVAQTLLREDPQAGVCFVSAGNPFERRVLAAHGLALETIAVEGLKGRGARRQARAALRLPGALFCALAILRRLRPEVVLGVGGYASGPVVLAARLLAIPTAIHEQNRRAGITNRLLAPLVSRVLLSFADTAIGGPSGRRRDTGNPIRPAIAAAAGPYRPHPEAPLRLLVLGGSQGARALNLACIDALEHLQAGMALRVAHQSGAADAPAVAAAYRRHGLRASVQPFFDDMPRRYREADLVIARAGASTLAEITAVGRAAILVPYPHAAEDHQTFNARALERAGAAEVIAERGLDGAALAGRIAHYADNRRALEEMAAAARGLGRPEAAGAIVAVCRELAAARRRRES